MNLFLSYTRHDEAAVRLLLADLEGMGDEVWMDQELSGGQNWWDHILARVRACDAFIVALTNNMLDSEACRRELEYALALKKPLLPIQVEAGLSMHLLPPALAIIEIIDFTDASRDALRSLSRALRSLPPAPPLPESLPRAPLVPVSYLGGLREQIDSTSTVDFNTQSVLVTKLSAASREAGLTKDVRDLLCRLRKRHDLYATIADEIDRLLETDPWRRPFPSRNDPREIETPAVPPHTAGRFIASFLGALSMTIVASLARTPRLLIELDQGVPFSWGILTPIPMMAALPGLAGAIAGAVTGGSSARIVISLRAGLLGWLAVCIVSQHFRAGHVLDNLLLAFANGGMVGAPAGALCGAVLSPWLSKADRARRRTAAIASPAHGK